MSGGRILRQRCTLAVTQLCQTSCASSGIRQYVFGDGGWTCFLCDGTIAETLAKLKKAGIVWTDGPRWKAAGRVADRVMNGVDL